MKYQSTRHQCKECFNLSSHEAFTEVKCDGCDKLLEPESTDYPTSYLQFNDALHVQLSGGYGEFIDMFTNEEHEGHAILCKNCAITFFTVNPWALGLFEESNKRWIAKVIAQAS